MGLLALQSQAVPHFIVFKSSCRSYVYCWWNPNTSSFYAHIQNTHTIRNAFRWCIFATNPLMEWQAKPPNVRKTPFESLLSASRPNRMIISTIEEFKCLKANLNLIIFQLCFWYLYFWSIIEIPKDRVLSSFYGRGELKTVSYKESSCTKSSPGAPEG